MTRSERDPTGEVGRCDTRRGDARTDRDGRDGPLAWLEDLVRCRHRALVARLTARLRHDADAADAMQDTYLRLVETGQRAADEGPAAMAETAPQTPDAYVARAARNAAIDRRREAMRRGRLHAAYGEAAYGGAAYGGASGNLGASGEGRRAWEPASSDPDPEQHLAARQRLEAVLRALDDLPPACREAFWLHRFDGLRYGEIADRLGCSASMVEKHIMRALKHLRKEVP